MGNERSELLSKAAAVATEHGAAVDLSLIEAYLADVADEDLVHREPVDLCGLVRSHLLLAQHRRVGHSTVRLLTPQPVTDGWTTGHTVVQIVTDDMPFLVDSVTNEISRAGRGIHLVVHPQVVVRRTPEAALTEVLGVTGSDEAPDPGAGAGITVESWMHLEIDRCDDPKADDRLAASLSRVIDDVRAANEDWGAMRERALRIADDLDGAAQPGVDPTDIAEGARLLRWLADDHFTFVGYREYVLGPGEPTADLTSVPTTGLGVLRGIDGVATVSRLGAAATRLARRREVLIITKANSRSTVHRAGYLDYIGVRTFDSEGRVVGERRFVGLLSSTAYTESVLDVPVIDRKAATVLATSGYGPRTHSGKALLAILENYPRDELFASDIATLTRITTAVQQLQERRRTRLLVRGDDFGRYVSCLVYLPRDRYTTQVRLAIEAVLMAAFDADGVEHSTQVSESVLARLHFIVRTPAGRGPGGLELAQVDLDEIERRVAACTRTWAEDLYDGLAGELGEADAVRMSRRWADALPEAYKEDVSPRTAVSDLVSLETLEAGGGAAPDLDLLLYNPAGAPEGEGRLKVFRREPLSVSQILPYFDHLGVEVLDQRPYRIIGVGPHDVVTDPDELVEPAEPVELQTWWIYDFGLRLPPGAVDPGTTTDRFRLARRFTDAFVAGWTATSESDDFDRLVLRAGLTWRHVVILRTYARYLRQGVTAFSEGYIASCLAENPQVARLLVAVFETRFHPDRFPAGPGAGPSAARRSAQQQAAEAVREVLEDVESLAQDQILRSMLASIEASLRTNFFQPGADGMPNPTVAIKLDPRRVPGLPQPRPAFEIWVCGPRVEGVHLRFGAVARGGLRWSDRREDFRTEILGLVKAQQVKNAVIVPTGAKGGFVGKLLPDPTADREAWYAEGTACYRLFVSALLDVTDNRDLAAGGAVVTPARVVRHDGVLDTPGGTTPREPVDDPYLVVAPDKGTAAFSDIANEISLARGFWLGDAFASGGSRGYDHKAMGITARGAWESVRRHFHDVDVDVDRDPFTVAGIGDMSGDVFGNGMLLSRSIRLVAAFDHRHVFIDPDPDPPTSFAERTRLFGLPRSSWDDYDRALISDGGGVFSRSAKVVELSEAAVTALGLSPNADGSPLRMTPAELVRSVLLAPVDLLWNGGIGTYVKASDETNAEVGDKANDALRIDGRQLRARVVGEGGNLGLTQRGRVEAAIHLVRLNTDAIDNSAGVDTSDHEVNIKIVLDRVVADGDLTAEQRNALLAEMTADVAAGVLRHNIDQNTQLGNARHQSRSMLPVYDRFLDWLGENGGLDRTLEYLPDHQTLTDRAAAGGSLVGPELCVITAYSKLSLTTALLASAVPDESWSQRFVSGYFPPQLRERYAERLPAHPLRREIIATTLANRVLNSSGSTFVFRLGEELSVSPDRAVRAWAVAAEVFGQAQWHAQVSDLVGTAPMAALNELRLAHRRVMDRSARWFLQSRPDPLDVDAEVARFAGLVRDLRPRMQRRLREAGRTLPGAPIESLTGVGVPRDMAVRSWELLDEFTLLDVAEIAARTGESPDGVLDVYVTVQERYGIDPVLSLITELPRHDRWQSLARAALRYDLYAAVEELTSVVVRTVPMASLPAPGAAARVEKWETGNATAIDRARQLLAEVRALPEPQLAPLQVALRTLRGAVKSGSAADAAVNRSSR